MPISGCQEFAWAERKGADFGESYYPNPTYTSPRPDGVLPHIAVQHTGIGLYAVTVGAHDVLRPYQAQVVAYGTDNVRSKFYARPLPWPCKDRDGPGWCTRFFVACVNPDGHGVDSQFVFSFTGISLDRPGLSGTGAFLQTADKGARIARIPVPIHGGYAESSVSAAAILKSDAALSDLPTVEHVSKGVYRVILPGLGTSNPGLAQVTALGEGATHCLALPPVETTDRTRLRIDVHGWDKTDRVDTDFILNYDQEVTRLGPPAHQAARAYADRWDTASYTPARSYNTGAIAESPGVNRAFRRGVGLYRMHHSALRSTPNSVWAGAAPLAFLNGRYCKIESWHPSGSNGTDVFIRCYDAFGKIADSPYYETYQGVAIGPS
ncbi:hypothetical protein [Nocardia sp. IFM 10818]